MAARYTLASFSRHRRQLLIANGLRRAYVESRAISHAANLRRRFTRQFEEKARLPSAWFGATRATLYGPHD